MMLFKHLVNFLLNTCYHLNVTNITLESQMSGKLGLDLTFNCHFHVKIMRFSTELLLMFAWLVCHNEIEQNCLTRALHLSKLSIILETC